VAVFLSASAATAQVKDVLSAHVRRQKATAGETARVTPSAACIRGADTDPLIEDGGGSDRYGSDSDSDTEDNDEIDGRLSQSFTRGNLRRQHDQALVNDPTLQQHYSISGSGTRSLVVREKALTIPAMTDRQIYDNLRGGTSISA
jgi:hypothetical protein